MLKTAKTPPMTAPSIGFGLETLSRPVIAHPIVALILVVGLSLVALWTASGIRFGDDPADLFRGDDPAYHTYEAYLDVFADGAEGALLIVDGDFQQPAHWASLRQLTTVLEASPGVGEIASIFSIEAIEQAAGPSGSSGFDDLPDFDDFENATDGADLEPVANPVIAQLRANELATHPLNAGRFLTPDLTSAAILIALDADMPLIEATSTFADATRRALATLPGGMHGHLTGPAIVRLSIVEKMISQQPLLLGGGLLAGFALGVFLLGRWSDAVIVAIMPIISILGIYGVFGAFGIEMTVLLNNLPLLVLALAFANSMHLVYAARRDLYQADYAFPVLAKTMAEIGPAVALSTLTTMIAFLSFIFSGSAAITEFGFVGAGAVAGVFISAMVVHPVTVWVALKFGWQPVPPMRGGWRAAKILEVAAGRLARGIYKAYRTVCLATLIVAGLAAVCFLQIQPSYSTLDDVPKRSETYVLMDRLDEQFGGTQTLHLPLPVTLSEGALDRDALQRLQRAHEAAVEAFPGRSVYSPWTFIDWLGETDRFITSTALRDMLAAAPAGLRRTLISDDGAHPALLVHLPTGDDQALSGAAAQLESTVGQAIGASLSGTVTGFAALSAQRSRAIITRLSLSLAIAALGGALLAAIAFRAVDVFLVTLLPNLLPVLMVGAILYLLGLPLQFASALAMTIALGIAVDDTVHVLNAYRKFRMGRDPRDALVKTLREVGPVLLVTTLVLSLGLMPALFSWSPGISVFAAFAITTILIALLADLVALPGLLAALAQFSHRRKITQSSQPR